MVTAFSGLGNSSPLPAKEPRLVYRKESLGPPFSICILCGGECCDCTNCVKDKGMTEVCYSCLGIRPPRFLL